MGTMSFATPLVAALPAILLTTAALAQAPATGGTALPESPTARVGQPGPELTQVPAKPTPAALGEVGGTWRLRALNGLALPAQVGQWQQDGATCRQQVTDATLWLLDDGTYAMDATLRRDCGDKAPAKTSEGERGTWRFSGDALYLDDDGIEGRDADRPQGHRPGIPIGNLGGTGQVKDGVLSVGLDDGKSLAVFGRVAGR